jgi:hypothetical protein
MRKKDYLTLAELDEMDYFDDKIIMNRKAYSQFKESIVSERLK